MLLAKRTRQISANTSHLTHTTKTIIYINATSSIFTEPDGQSSNQHHSREHMMLGVIVAETC